MPLVNDLSGNAPVVVDRGGVWFDAAVNADKEGYLPKGMYQAVMDVGSGSTVVISTRARPTDNWVQVTSQTSDAIVECALLRMVKVERTAGSTDCRVSFIRKMR